MKIELNGQPLDLCADIQLDIEEKNPVMNDRGSQTIPITIPTTSRNMRATGFAHRTDISTLPDSDSLRCLVSCGAYLRTGKANIVSAGRSEGVTLNIGFDNSEAYSKWVATKLSDITCPEEQYPTVEALCSHMRQVFLQGDTSTDTPYALFELLVDNPSKTDNDVTTHYPLYLNRLTPTETLPDGTHRYDLVTESHKETLLVDGKPTTVSLPQGYAVTPFLYVWRILELVFGEYGYTIEENPFKTDPALSRLVILNNAADCCTTTTLNFRELMPDCTVEEFLQALYARFGMVYTIDGSRNTASIALIRDILAATPTEDLTNALSGGWPLITYETHRQVTLKAATSFEGAAPANERYEDFTDGSRIAHVAHFEETANTYLIHEKPTGRWYKWDESARKAVFVGSSHFSWNRQTPGVDNLDIESIDESIPMQWHDTIPVPAYLAGCRHRHTYIRVNGVNQEASDDASTPLAFCLALPTLDTPDDQHALGGTITPWRYDGQRVTMSDMSPHHSDTSTAPFPFSLTWQGDDGLFSRFWRAYDAILRHAWAKVECQVALPAHRMPRLPMLEPVAIQGQHFLIDTIAYALPAPAPAIAQLTLRTLRLVKPYDLDTEQGIPAGADPSSAALVWVLQSDTFEQQAAILIDRLKAVAIAEAQGKWPAWSGIAATYAEYHDVVADITPQTDQQLRNITPEYQGQVITRYYECELVVTIHVAGNENGTTQTDQFDYSNQLQYTATFVATRQ